MNIEQVIAARLGQLMLENAKLALIVEALQAEIAKLKAGEAERPIDEPLAGTNGHAEAAH